MSQSRENFVKHWQLCCVTTRLFRQSIIVTPVARLNIALVGVTTRGAWEWGYTDCTSCVYLTHKCSCFGCSKGGGCRHLAYLASTTAWTVKCLHASFTSCPHTHVLFNTVLFKGLFDFLYMVVRLTPPSSLLLWICPLLLPPPSSFTLLPSLPLPSQAGMRVRGYVTCNGVGFPLTSPWR